MYKVSAFTIFLITEGFARVQTWCVFHNMTHKVLLSNLPLRISLYFLWLIAGVQVRRLVEEVIYSVAYTI